MATLIDGHEVPRRIRNTGEQDATAYQVQHAGRWRRVRYALDSTGLHQAAKYVTVQGQPVPVVFDPPL